MLGVNLIDDSKKGPQGGKHLFETYDIGMKHFIYYN